jgi:hypothetical protein
VNKVNEAHREILVNVEIKEIQDLKEMMGIKEKMVQM